MHVHLGVHLITNATHDTEKTDLFLELIQTSQNNETNIAEKTHCRETIPGHDPPLW